MFLQISMWMLFHFTPHISCLLLPVFSVVVCCSVFWFFFSTFQWSILYENYFVLRTLQIWQRIFLIHAQHVTISCLSLCQCKKSAAILRVRRKKIRAQRASWQVRISFVYPSKTKAEIIVTHNNVRGEVGMGNSARKKKRKGAIADINRFIFWTCKWKDKLRLPSTMLYLNTYLPLYFKGLDPKIMRIFWSIYTILVWSGQNIFVS